MISRIFKNWKTTIFAIVVIIAMVVLLVTGTLEVGELTDISDHFFDKLILLGGGATALYNLGRKDPVKDKDHE
jgi:hypothetical protein